ncbi:MAG: hypothetical protein WC728_00385 [Elusimicrobiota bacterium]
MAKDDDAVWVGSGSFRIDREKALETLLRFQLPDPTQYLLCWVRTACAAGAPEIRIGVSPEGLEMRFNGEPFAYDELKDPYAALFGSSGGRSAALRHLAYGLLAALRTVPESITVASGTGKGRALLEVSSLSLDRVERVEEEAAGTVIRVIRPKDGTVSKALGHIRGSTSMCPAEVFIRDERAAPLRDVEEALCVSVEEDGVRALLWVPEELAARSRVELHVLGVWVDTVELELPAAQVWGRVNDDRLQLNASLTGVVRDDRYRAVVNRLPRAAERLVMGVSSRLGESLPKTARLLRQDEVARLVWAERMTRGAGSVGGDILHALSSLLSRIRKPQRTPELASVDQDALAVRWLRDLCGRTLADAEQDESIPLKKTLWNAPLYLSMAGTPLTLKELEKLHSKDEKLRYWVHPSGSSSVPIEDKNVLYTVSARELNLLQQRYHCEAL